MINLVEPGGSGERETLKKFTNNIYNGCDDNRCSISSDLNPFPPVYDF